MNGLYFYKLQSPYKEDVTKNCKLTVNEIDSNFLTLKDADVKEASYDKETKVITISRNNGDTMPIDLSESFQGITKDFNVEYDEEEGAIYLSYNGNTVAIKGLITDENNPSKPFNGVVTDGTLWGVGINGSPLGLSPVEKTGMYKPVKKFVDTMDGELLPPRDARAKGDRYLINQMNHPYGLLYNFETANKISADMLNGWRVPTKADWDATLNAVEPCKEYRNHDSSVANNMLGKYAGKRLKSVDKWINSETCGSQTDDDDTTYVDDPSEVNESTPTPQGTDNYKMTVLPAGHFSECEHYSCFKERGYFWTTSQTTDTDVYVKRFDYDKAGVVQMLEAPQSYLSVRLVKDFDGVNFHESEYIAGKTYRTVLMPALGTESGFKVWLAENFASEKDGYSYKVPNDGYGIEGVKTYYIIEWTGFEWASKELTEGDAVVLNKGLSGETNMVYRIMDGELYSDADVIEEEVLESIQEELDTMRSDIDDNAANISTITQAVDSLDQRVSDAETELNTETETREAADSALLDSITTEQNDRASADEELRGEINTLSQNVDLHYQEFEQLSEDVDDIRRDLDDITSGTTEEIDEIVHSLERLINNESSYDSVNGTLTLAADNEENNIVIQFNGDYGTF